VLLSVQIQKDIVAGKIMVLGATGQQTTSVHGCSSSGGGTTTKTTTTPTATNRTTRKDGTEQTRVCRSNTPDRRLGVRSRSRSKSLTRPEAYAALLGEAHTDNEAFEQKVRKCIPAEFMLIASQDDVTQAQEDYFAMDNFKLPPLPASAALGSNAKALSLATSALLEFLYESPSSWTAPRASKNSSKAHVLQVLQEIKKRVARATKREAKPTISSSRPLGPPTFPQMTGSGSDGVYAPFYIVPPGFTGTRRALLIGVRSGQGPMLRGPANDLAQMQQFLQRHCGFSPENFHIFWEDDDGDASTQPTKRNILRAFTKMTKLSQSKDVLFIQYSGHGGRSGNSLFLIPSDYKTAGEIKDEIILRDLIKAMPRNTYTTMLVDCCYSGTVGDLPYILQDNLPSRLAARSKNGSRVVHQKIEHYFDTDTRSEMLGKEASGDEMYWDIRKARADKRVFDRLTAPAKMLAEAAASAFQEVGQGLSQAATSASEAGTAAFEALNSSFSGLSLEGSFSALSLDGSFSALSLDASSDKPSKRSSSSRGEGGEKHSSLTSFLSNTKPSNKFNGGGGSKSGVSRASTSNRSRDGGGSVSNIEALNGSLSNFFAKTSTARQKMASLRSDTLSLASKKSADDSTTKDSMDMSARNRRPAVPRRTFSTDGSNFADRSQPTVRRAGKKKPMQRSSTYAGPGGSSSSALREAAEQAKAAAAELRARQAAVERSRREAAEAREAARRQKG